MTPSHTTSNSEQEDNAAMSDGMTPDGWVMAPREPDDAMLEAGAGSLLHGTPGSALVCYRAMIAASPVAPELLAALQEIADLAWGSRTANTLPHIERIARAAIAKAGERP